MNLHLIIWNIDPILLVLDDRRSSLILNNNIYINYFRNLISTKTKLLVSFLLSNIFYGRGNVLENLLDKNPSTDDSGTEIRETLRNTGLIQYH